MATELLRVATESSISSTGSTSGAGVGSDVLESVTLPSSAAGLGLSQKWSSTWLAS